jgi:small subunit ribosomal protein S14
MKNLNQKDKQNRKLAFQFENTRLIFKSIIKNKKILSTVRWNAILKLENLPKNSSKSKFNTRCILTNRKKGIVSKFRLSRLAFLKFSSLGQITGIKKSVW